VFDAFSAMSMVDSRRGNVVSTARKSSSFDAVFDVDVGVGVGASSVAFLRLHFRFARLKTKIEKHFKHTYRWQ
jgi:hypothetical protein